MDNIESERNQIVVFSLIGFGFIAFFGSIEFNQAKQSFVDYLLDYWNYIDCLSLGLNAMFLIMLNTNCMLENNEVFSKEHIRLNAGIGCFTLWVKLFYWMRLFKVTAYFITLITRTIMDIKVFIVMLSILLIAFGSFFSIINTNTPEFYPPVAGEE